MSPHESPWFSWEGVGGETKEVMGAYLGVFVFPRGSGDSICVWPCNLLHAFLKGSDSQAFRCMRRWLTRLRNRASKTRCFCGMLAGAASPGGRDPSRCLLSKKACRLDTRGRWSITCITTMKFCDTHANDLARNMMTCELPMLFLDYRIHSGGGGAASGFCSARSSLH